MLELWWLWLLLLIFIGAVGWWIWSSRYRTRQDRERGPSRASTKAPQAKPTTTFTQLGSGLRRLLSRQNLDDEFWRVLEEELLQTDLGVETTKAVITSLKNHKATDGEQAKSLLSELLLSEFTETERSLEVTGSPGVIVVVGVNGTGKTTTIGKLAHYFASTGKKVLLGGADTFRAAAGEQLRLWSDRLGTQVVVGSQGADAGAVAVDAIRAGRARGADVVIVDTAGRLSSNTNLMAELSKVERVSRKEAGTDNQVVVWLCLDATGGQNSLKQAEQFGAALSIEGVILTKLDSSARGGIVVSVEKNLGIPVLAVGVGEKQSDFSPFVPEEFVGALLEE